MSLASSVGVALLTGLAFGMLLFIISVGLTLIFGVLDVLNFAHGSLFMLGAYFTVLLVSSPILGGVYAQFWIAVAIGAVLVAIIGGVMERLFIRPIYGEDHVFQLLLTFALVLIIDNGARIVWGTGFRSVSVPDILSFQVSMFGRPYPAYNLFLIAVGAIIAVSMWLVFERTRIGKTVRAASQDREMANVMGINVPRVFTLTFIFGSALAGIGGAFAAPFQAVQPAMGEQFIILAFIIVVIGGLGSFGGALLGALLIGIVDALAFQFAGGIRSLIPFLLMVVVLMIKPEGLFGGDST